MQTQDDSALAPGVVIRREELDDLAGLNPASPEFKQRLQEHMAKRKELDELQELARKATRSALENYEPIPEEWSQNLTLGTLFDGEDRIFELYVASERPSDAIVLASTRVNRITKSVKVTITNLRRTKE
ncbi:hypothetical protein [Piscinibacter gummiphilus]|uniref:Uncharacterized protein n=1 Tax=Piscinibacter gummiphilus TaxID=946333 RepID=A0ABZ0CPE3_9BURK|nr:hypothetical protein [Piscinibacter gummiphilus]WOB06856.1 hypothetical protein RXV79_18260 [Piscinibacter gummiphilus]